MSAGLSVAEIDGQRVELLPARTVLGVLGDLTGSSGPDQGQGPESNAGQELGGGSGVGGVVDSLNEALA